MRKWIITNLILKVLDLGITAAIIFKTAKTSETNPIVRWVIDNLGVVPGLVLVFVIFCGILYFAFRHKSLRALKIVAGITLLVVVNNLVWLYLVFWS